MRPLFFAFTIRSLSFASIRLKRETMQLNWILFMQRERNVYPRITSNASIPFWIGNVGPVFHIFHLYKISITDFNNIFYPVLFSINNHSNYYGTDRARWHSQLNIASSYYLVLRGNILILSAMKMKYSISRFFFKFTG